MVVMEQVFIDYLSLIAFSKRGIIVSTTCDNVTTLFPPSFCINAM